VFEDANGVSNEQVIDSSADLKIGEDIIEAEENQDETQRKLNANKTLDPKLTAMKEPFDDHEEIHDNLPVVVKQHKTHKWLVYNKHIKYGYRTNYTENHHLLKSLCSCHNETANIWTHLSGAIILLGLIFYSVWFWTPLRLEFGSFVSKMKSKNWGDFSHANNYDDIISYFKAITTETLKGSRLYEKLNELYDENESLFQVGTEKFREGIQLLMTTFSDYFAKKAPLLQSDVNAFSYLFN